MIRKLQISETLHHKNQTAPPDLKTEEDRLDTY